MMNQQYGLLREKYDNFKSLVVEGKISDALILMEEVFSKDSVQVTVLRYEYTELRKMSTQGGIDKNKIFQLNNDLVKRALDLFKILMENKTRELNKEEKKEIVGGKINRNSGEYFSANSNLKQDEKKSNPSILDSYIYDSEKEKKIHKILIAHMKGISTKELSKEYNVSEIFIQGLIGNTLLKGLLFKNFKKINELEKELLQTKAENEYLKRENALSKLRNEEMSKIKNKKK